MSQCTQRYLPLCSIPARMSKDGFAGETAKIFLPFSDAGLYFFSGAQFVPVGDTVAQDKSKYLGGVAKPDTYMKEGCFCGNRP